MVTNNSINTYIVPTTSNEVTMPSQPVFLGELSATDTNVTGNGTTFVIGTGNVFTEIFDQNADFNVNGTFTSPVTGVCLFSVGIEIFDAATATSSIVELVTSNRTYAIGSTNINNILNLGSGGVIFVNKTLADMDAADTAVMQITANGMGADNADIRDVTTHFGGLLAC